MSDGQPRMRYNINTLEEGEMRVTDGRTVRHSETWRPSKGHRASVCKVYNKGGIPGNNGILKPARKERTPEQIRQTEQNRRVREANIRADQLRHIVRTESFKPTEAD